MNILPFNSLNLYNGNACYNNRADYNRSNFGLKITQPLSADTVSFQGTTKVLTSRKGTIPRQLANKIHSIAEERQIKVKTYMNDLLGDMVATTYSPSNPIYKLADRAKTADSIVEKAATRGWVTKNDILTYMTDLNGAKIILRDGSRKEVDKVLDRFIKSIVEGTVDLIEIENKRPIIAQNIKGPERLKYDYASPEKLEYMCKITDEIHPSEKVKYEAADYTKMNYPALHFLFKLPGKNWTFELQMMGYDVALYKDLDDVIYKILNNKNVDKKYKKLVAILAPLNEPGNATLKEQFNEYRSNVFLFQRDKAPHIRKNGTYTERFLPISHEIEDVEMSELLDMNNLYNIYCECNGKTKMQKKITKK